MKTTFVTLLLFVGVSFAGVSLVRSDPPVLPDVEYTISGHQSSQDTFTAEIWVQSNTYGIACAFVDLIANLPVTNFTYGPDWTVFNEQGEIDEFGVINLGGCALIANGTGQAPEWSLLATVDFDIPVRARQFWASLDRATHPLLITAIVGAPWEPESIDYGRTFRHRLSKSRSSSRTIGNQRGFHEVQ